MSKALSVYYKAFETQIAEIEKAAQSGSAKPRLLLHACCGPCSSAVLETLVQHFEITILYYNPNIYPEAEYLRRKDELCRFLPAFLNEKAPPVIELSYEPQDFYEAAKSVDGFESMPEKGERCRMCYRLRLMRCAEEAFTRHFDYFTTTLSISPHKDAEKINEEGKAAELVLQKKAGAQKIPQYLYADFKKKNGFKRSLELSEEYGLYRQDYCGCVYSSRNNSRGVDSNATM